MSKHLLVAATALGSLAIAAPAIAQIEFASFDPTPSSTGGVVNFKNDGNGHLTSVSTSTPTKFAFQLTPLANFGTLNSTFNFSATQSGPGTNNGGSLKALFDGSFNYVYSGPTTTNGGITLTTGESLLSGTFKGAAFTGVAGASGGGLADDSITGSVVYTSAIPAADLPLASTGQSFSLAFIDISPILALQAKGGDLRDFHAVADGTFSSDLTTGGGGGVPEPTTWALMLVGVGAVGVAARRRRMALATA